MGKVEEEVKILLDVHKLLYDKELEQLASIEDEQEGAVPSQ